MFDLEQICDGGTPITAEIAIRLEQGIGGSAETWMTMQANYDLARVRARSPHISLERLGPKAA